MDLFSQTNKLLGRSTKYKVIHFRTSYFTLRTLFYGGCVVHYFMNNPI